MNGPVTSPRIFGHPLWSWAGLLTIRGSWDGERIRRPWWVSVSRFVLWRTCRLVTGHRQALGETGYGGGGMLDVFCAYCHYPWQVPAAETPSAQVLVDLFHGPPPEVS